MGRILGMIFKVLIVLLLGGAIFSTLFVMVVGRDKVMEMVFGPMVIKAVDFSTLTLAPTPNQFLVCPENFCQVEPHFESPTFDVSAQELKRRWMDMISQQSNIEIGVADEALQQYDFIQRTDLVRYPDSITVRFLRVSSKSSSVAIYSRSHYGKSDFGVNEKRIRTWLDLLKKRRLNKEP